MITSEKIDISESIKKGKLVLKTKQISKVLIIGVQVFFIGIIPISSLVLTFKNEMFWSNYPLLFISGNLVAILIAFVLFKLLTSGRKLKRFSGKTIDENREMLLTAINCFGWELHRNEKNLIIALLNWRAQITVIFDGKDMLINTIRFGRSETQGIFEEGMYQILKDKLAELKNAPKEI